MNFAIYIKDFSNRFVSPTETNHAGDSTRKNAAIVETMLILKPIQIKVLVLLEINLIKNVTYMTAMQSPMHSIVPPII